MAAGGAHEGTTERRRGICGICPAGCFIEAELHDGRLVALQPDRTHSLGMLCRRGEHAPEIVYSEHRLRHPLRRKGPKGTLDFEPISWDDAYGLIVDGLRRIARESGPEAAAIYTGRGAFELSLCDFYQPKDVAVSSASNVLFPFGSPNTMGVGALCYVSFAMMAPHVTMGRMLIDMFTDIENAEMLVVWGANPATDSPPLDMARLEAAAARGADIIVIDPRRTETVARTGAEWVPIRPGTDGALALSMVGVLLDEDLHDEDFAQRWCHGFADLARYVQHFRPELVEDITGVPAHTIRRLARRIAGATGACPVMYTGLEYSNTGLQAVRAVLTLFALAGQLDVPGGIGLAMPGSHFPINRAANQPNPAVERAVGRELFPLYTHYRGESHASALVDSVLRGEPYRIRGLIVQGASLLTSWPEPQLWRETLQSLDLLVTIDRTLTADAAYADVVLPATTMFEIDSYMTYGPAFRLREKLIAPVGEARNDYLIMAELASRLGYGELYPQTEDAMIRMALGGSGFSLEQVREAGGMVKLPSPMMEYRKWEKGRLRADGRPGFETPTGKFEIASTVLAEFGYEALPVYTEPVEGPRAAPGMAERYPLVFNSGARPQTDFRSQHHGVVGLMADAPEPTVDLNTVDAEQRGIGSGDLVEVRTQRGAVPFRARVTDAIMAGAVECSMGGGGVVGPKAWREWNVNDLTDLRNADPISGFPVYKALLCEVTRVEGGAVRSEGQGAADTDGAGRGGHGGSGAAVGVVGEEGGRGGHGGSAVPVGVVCDDAAGSGARRPTGRDTTGCGVVAPHLHAQSQRRVRLDGNATTPLHEAVLAAMEPYLREHHGNPSSIHAEGRHARGAVDVARRQVARLIGAKPRRVVFTGGGSEADNLAIKGVAFASHERRHVIVSAIEHPAVLESCRFLERLGYRVTVLGPDRVGLLRPEALRSALTDETALVSVMAANNEVGTVQPIAELAALAHERGALFHTDAVQAAGKIPLDVDALGVDLLTLSAHKLQGPKGVGALFVRQGVELEPLVHGGRQERGLRAGTENVAGIVGMGKAAELALQSLSEGPRLAALRDRLERGVRERWPAARLNGHVERRLPNTVNLTLPGLRGESLVVAMDLHGISLSSGSACKSGSPDPTHVLLAMGLSAEEAHCSVRFSLTRETTVEDIDATLAALATVLEEMESTVRFLPCK